MQSAEESLRSAMLSTMGAEFAVGPLEGIAELFGHARLMFRPRLAPTLDRSVPASVESWTPVSPATLH